MYHLYNIGYSLKFVGSNEDYPSSIMNVSCYKKIIIGENNLCTIVKKKSLEQIFKPPRVWASFSKLLKCLVCCGVVVAPLCFLLVPF